MKSIKLIPLFWILVFALGVYEVFALFSAAQGDTISEIVWRLAETRPIVSFLFGLLMGHFFWQKT